MTHNVLCFNVFSLFMLGNLMSSYNAERCGEKECIFGCCKSQCCSFHERSELDRKRFDETRDRLIREHETATSSGLKTFLIAGGCMVGVGLISSLICLYLRVKFGRWPMRRRHIIIQKTCIDTGRGRNRSNYPEPSAPGESYPMQPQAMYPAQYPPSQYQPYPPSQCSQPQYPPPQWP